MPVKPIGYAPPHKAVTKITDLLAKHKGQANWTEIVVTTTSSMATTSRWRPARKRHGDSIRTTAFWVVQDGQIRFTIEGQEPFVASKGFLVQVPKRLIYSMETVGTRHRCGSR